MFQVNPDSNMQEMVAKITQMYQAKGFTVMPMAMGVGVSIDFRKDDDGFKKFVGLGVGVKCNITINNGTMCIDFTDASWTGKIVAFVIGWFLCWIPWITAIIGTVNQVGLPKSISNDIQMMVGGAMPFGAQPYGTAPQQQAYQQPQQQTQQILCKNCGASLNANSKFCPSCGTQRD